jgi:hypothetical protein
MLTTDLRQRLLEKVQEAAAGGDEETVSMVLTYARAALIALARYPGYAEVSLPGLVVGTRTAALILGMHPEYVRSLIRHGQIQAAKENGEFQIRLTDVVEASAIGRVHLLGEFGFTRIQETMERTRNMLTLWERPHESP